MINRWDAFFGWIIGFIVGGFLVYTLTLDNPNQDKPNTNYHCVKVYDPDELPQDWALKYHRSESGLWWDEATPFAFQQQERSNICIFREEK